MAACPSQVNILRNTQVHHLWNKVCSLFGPRGVPMNSNVNSITLLETSEILYIIEELR